ncbi:hypothetical protein [Moheibacter sediminis]|uniref:Tetratricopeptide repeat-containing protein n=1 Tax=Moheibacter sediminis TaxID=1434700 RepID=A0A1W2CFX3_9FLAO|nr:hypothetical protein [Moheibacter sediminis]SMC84069.1 hypothetical protein SAMN06296427_11035 [Moheibacter sediminis]
MRNLKFVIILIFSVLCQLSLAQNNKEIDSLIAEANSFIFKNPQKTIQIGEEILERKNISNSYKISSYILIANGYAALNEYEKSIDFAIKANNLSAETKDHANQIRTLGFIGNQYIRIEMRDEAWYYLDKADKLSQTASLPDSMKYLIGNINLLKGFLYKRSLDCEYAIKHFNKAIIEFRKDEGNGFAVANLGQAYNQKGFCYMSIDKDSAELSFWKGLADARKNGAKSLECNALIGLAEIQNFRKDFKGSTEMLSEALMLSKEVQQIEMENRIYKLLADNYLATDDFENHLLYKNLFESTQSKVLADNTKSVNELIKKRNEEKREIYDSNENKFILVLSTLIFIFISSILFLGYFLWKKSQKIRKMKPVTDL